MVTRALERAETQLDGLRREEWTDVCVGAAALAAAVVASVVEQQFALPLLAGGAFVAVRALRAGWLRWDLVDRLLDDPDAYAIPEVRARAARSAALANRRDLAHTIRCLQIEGRLERIEPLQDELSALARALDDDALVLDPAAAVGCERLLRDPTSPLYAADRSTADVRSCIARASSGFAAR